MISEKSRPYIAASVPLLREHGVAITTRFYREMFEAHPELKNIFNLGNQRAGLQPQSLAAAVFAYAANIDNAAALAPVLERIVHKHASVGVKPSQYVIVGQYLLGAVREVLGEAATPELMAAWDEAYWLLAGELIAAESRTYMAAGAKAGELRSLRVERLVDESPDIRSLYLVGDHGGSPGSFEPGQYVSVAVDFSELGLRQLRQYTLSDAPGRPWWRITVKRERERDGWHEGTVSSWLHDRVAAGTRLSVSAPFGDFTPLRTTDGGIALLSAGVGVTPMIAILNQLVDEESARPVLFAHAAPSAQHRGFASEIERARAALAGLRVAMFDERGEPGPNGTKGRMVVDPIIADLADYDAYCLCGPAEFMRDQWRSLVGKGISPTRIYREVFGPDLLQHLV